MNNQSQSGTQNEQAKKMSDNKGADKNYASGTRTEKDKDIDVSKNKTDRKN